MPYKITIKHLNGQVLKIKNFDTKQERNEYYNDRNIGDNILIKNEYYTIRTVMRRDELFMFYVRDKK